MPSSLQAADYSAALQYLKAVASTGRKDPHKVVGHLRASTLNDMYLSGGRLREDGSMLHDFYLLRAKTPESSTEPWDYYDLVATLSGDEALPIE